MEERRVPCDLCPPSVSICGMNEDMMTEQERTLTAPEAVAGACSSSTRWAAR